ncbi:retinoic acid receptor responder protein 2 isoform 1-T2 [Mantella aurantiaca]
MRWAVLSALLLLLGVQGDVPGEELSEVQNKVIQKVMETFHQRKIPNAFRMTSIEKANEELYVGGIFVSVEFLVRQTLCLRNDWKKADCQPAKNAKIYNCFGCYKLEYDSHSVISHVEECIQQRYLDKGRKARRNDLCNDVEKKDNGKKNVGRYSFLKSE